MTETLIHAAITTGIMSLALFFIYRFVNRADQVKADEEKQWRERVMSMFTKLESKITSYCQDNHESHNELYAARNELSLKVERLSTEHNIYKKIHTGVE